MCKICIYCSEYPCPVLSTAYILKKGARRRPYTDIFICCGILGLVLYAPRIHGWRGVCFVPCIQACAASRRKCELARQDLTCVACGSDRLADEGVVKWPYTKCRCEMPLACLSFRFQGGDGTFTPTAPACHRDSELPTQSKVLDNKHGFVIFTLRSCVWISAGSEHRDLLARAPGGSSVMLAAAAWTPKVCKTMSEAPKTSPKKGHYFTYFGVKVYAIADFSGLESC